MTIGTPHRPLIRLASMSMRLATAEHMSRPWRIHRVAPDFTVEDVWALPVHGQRDDFAALVRMMTSDDGDHEIGFLDSAPARVLWRFRDFLGRAFNIGAINDTADQAAKRPIPGDSRTSLTDRLDADLLGTADDLRFSSVPMEPLYRLDDEFASELSNATMHGVMHLSWVRRGNGIYQGQMAVLVKPRGSLGAAYMAAIKPFRQWIVYPALLRYFEKTWRADHD